MWPGEGTGFSSRTSPGSRLRSLTFANSHSVRRQSRLLSQAMALREHAERRLIMSNCLGRRRQRRLTAGILFFVPAMPTIAHLAEREPAPRWLVSMRMDTSLRVRFGGRKGYWERILTEACQ